MIFQFDLNWLCRFQLVHPKARQTPGLSHPLPAQALRHILGLFGLGMRPKRIQFFGGQRLFVLLGSSAVAGKAHAAVQ